MFKLIALLGICSALTAGSIPPKELPPKHPGNHTAGLLAPNDKCQKTIGCYFGSSTMQVPGKDLSIELIDVSLCTHLFYNSATLGKDASVQLIINEENNEFQRLDNLRKKNRHLKTLIDMEELIEEAENNNKILFDPILREKLVNNIVDFVKKYKFNGIELQSQYLVEYNADESDKQNFVLLMKSLRKKFDKNRLILSLAFKARESTANKYDIKGISKYVDFINLRTYNFHGDNIYNTDEIKKVGHIAPLYNSKKENMEERKLNVDYIVKYWISQHAPPNKILLGTIFRGISYNLANPKQFGRDAPVVEGKEYSLPTFNYYDICSKEKNRVWKSFFDKEQQVPYIYKGKEMIAYDNAVSLKMKAEYANKMKLGGVFVDSIEQDDFSGHCGGEKFPLLKAMNRVLRDKC